MTPPQLAQGRGSNSKNSTSWDTRTGSFKATFFITEGLNFLENKEHYMIWEEVQKLHEEGFEIGNHHRSTEPTLISRGMDNG